MSSPNSASGTSVEPRIPVVRGFVFANQHVHALAFRDHLYQTTVWILDDVGQTARADCQVSKLDGAAVNQLMCGISAPGGACESGRRVERGGGQNLGGRVPLRTGSGTIRHWRDDCEREARGCQAPVRPSSRPAEHCRVPSQSSQCGLRTALLCRRWGHAVPAVDERQLRVC